MSTKDKPPSFARKCLAMYTNASANASTCARLTSA